MTRAVWSAVRLRFNEAFTIILCLVLYPSCLYYIYWLQNKNPLCKVHMGSNNSSVLVSLYIRLLFYPNNIVLIDINNGFMLKFIQNKIWRMKDDNVKSLTLILLSFITFGIYGNIFCIAMPKI